MSAPVASIPPAPLVLMVRPPACRLLESPPPREATDQTLPRAVSFSEAHSLRSKLSTPIPARIGLDAPPMLWGDDRESLEPYVYGLREAIKIQANLAASHLS